MDAKKKADLQRELNLSAAEHSKTIQSAFKRFPLLRDRKLAVASNDSHSSQKANFPIASISQVLCVT